MSEGVCEVWFYHLERSSLDEVLPELLERTLTRGWKALVRVEDAETAKRLDAALWTYRDDAFLPHGLAWEAFAARQPVLLTTEAEATNGAEALFALGVDPGDLAGFSRCIVIFDGRDADRRASARKIWTRCKTAGHPVSYWRQGEARGWTREA